MVEEEGSALLVTVKVVDWWWWWWWWWCLCLRFCACDCRPRAMQAAGRGSHHRGCARRRRRWPPTSAAAVGAAAGLLLLPPACCEGRPRPAHSAPLQPMQAATCFLVSGKQRLQRALAGARALCSSRRVLQRVARACRTPADGRAGFACLLTIEKWSFTSIDCRPVGAIKQRRSRRSAQFRCLYQ